MCEIDDPQAFKDADDHLQCVEKIKAMTDRPAAALAYEMARKKTKPLMEAMSEHEIHKAVVKYLDQCGRKDILWFHPENARKCTPRQGAMRKAIGVKAGVPDFVLIIDGDPVFLELKSAKGKLSKEQQAFLDKAESCGCRYYIAKSLNEAITVLEFIDAIDKRFVRKA